MITVKEIEDIEKIRMIAEKVWPETYYNILSQDQISYMMNWMYSSDSLEDQMKQGHHFFMAKAHDENLGFISCENKSNAYVKIHKLYVLQDKQHHGVGKLLIQRVIQFAKEHQVLKLRLNVNRFNKAQGFYERMGFKIIGEENIEIGNDFLMEDFVMEKTI